MKKGSFLMLLLVGSLLMTIVGFANTNVIEQPSSEKVILVDFINTITSQEVFVADKINDYVSFDEIVLLGFGPHGEPFYFNSGIVLLCNTWKEGRSPPPMMVFSDLQILEKESFIQGLEKEIFIQSKRKEIFIQTELKSYSSKLRPRAIRLQLVFYKQKHNLSV